MNTELILETENFLKSTFEHSKYFGAHPVERDYRLEHSYRVANIAREIAAAENLDETCAVIGGLLHDIAYCNEMSTREERREHGRNSAKIARPFLEDWGLSPEQINDICYAIAIHVDDKADFEWERTAFSETIGDADNIDRFDAYRIYENLEYKKFRDLPLAEKKEHIEINIEHFKKLREMPLGTKTAVNLWKDRIDFYISFYERLKTQFEISENII